MAQEKFIETRYGKICYLDSGGGYKTVVFIHGWIGWPVMFSLLTRRLQRLGYRVVAMYLPGHGKSFYLPHNFGFSKLVATLEEVIKKVAPKGELFLIGQSIGGAVVWELVATKRLICKKLILLDALLGYGGDGVLSLFLRWLFGQVVDLTCWTWTRILGKNKRVDSMGFGHVQFLPRRLWYMIPTVDVSTGASIRVPVLALWGQQDFVVPLERYKPLLEGLNQVEVRAFPGAHYWFGWHQEQYLEAVESFLEDKR